MVVLNQKLSSCLTLPGIATYLNPPVTSQALPYLSQNTSPNCHCEPLSQAFNAAPQVMGLVTSLKSKISKAKFQALAAAQALVTVLMPTTSGGRPCFTWQLGFVKGQTGKPLDISTDWLFPKHPPRHTHSRR